tara:strand:- start:471 stop:590 length:120 start_codon:yes stop_codon:yes gene_type:complete
MEAVVVALVLLEQMVLVLEEHLEVLVFRLRLLDHQLHHQ